LLPREWTVADVGTGTGYLLPLLSRRFDRVIAVDSVPAMLELARARPGFRETCEVEFHPGDLSALPIEDCRVDLCLASLVLHHVASPASALAELARITKPGGRLLIIEQQAHQHVAFYDLMQDRSWGFDPAVLAQQVGQVGFEAVEWSPLESAEPTHAQAPEAPELFVMTAVRKTKR
ncbi:MAG: class I SAM-dependent methyltransferase, partial [Phycisphaerae bacterium]